MPGGAGMTLMWVRNWPSPIKFGFSDGCIHATRGELLIEATIANPQMDGIFVDADLIEPCGACADAKALEHSDEGLDDFLSLFLTFPPCQLAPLRGTQERKACRAASSGLAGGPGASRGFNLSGEDYLTAPPVVTGLLLFAQAEINVARSLIVTLAAAAFLAHSFSVICSARLFSAAARNSGATVLGSTSF
jgi:hypothetical protein